VTPEADLEAAVAALDLVDHHCHSVVGHDLDRSGFEALLGEGLAGFDSSLGLAVRAWCAPFLDLPAGVEADTYLARRAELGADEVNARFLATGARRLLVDTGYRGDELAGLDRMAAWAGGPVHEVARLESLAEETAASLARSGSPAATYADRLAVAMADHPAAVAWKSVAAYRGGLDLGWARPAPGEVADAAGEWLDGGPPWRLEHPVLIRHGVWAAIDSGRPLQFHTGFGDRDADLRTADPTHLTPLLAATADGGPPILLLHTWPYHRHAGHLAQLWRHVHVDVGEALPHVGGRAPEVLAELLELAPWGKVLYSSDAFGLAELYHLGALTHRRALAAVLAPLAGAGFGRPELLRLAALVTSGNARRVYGLQA
jgi:predicted TIM-barrel fold metal-dependent hydrolase